MVITISLINTIFPCYESFKTCESTRSFLSLEILKQKYSLTTATYLYQQGVTCDVAISVPDDIDVIAQWVKLTKVNPKIVIKKIRRSNPDITT